MKKITTLIFALSVGIETILALGGTCGTNVSWSINLQDSILTISGTGAMNDYSSSWSKEAPWCGHKNRFKSVQIMSGVTSIGNCAFYECYIKAITIPNSIVSIGDSAFYGCSSLPFMTIQSGVLSIGKHAFSHCSSMSSINVANDNQNYSSDGGTLYNKDKTFLIQYPLGQSATSFSIPNSVTTVGSNAFASCKNLNSVILPNSVTCIGESAFYFCSGLSSITIPTGVTIIKDRAFLYCTNLKTVVMSDSVTYIGEWAFASTNIRSITIPETIESIGLGAFSYCSRLNYVTWNAKACSDFPSTGNPFYSNLEPESDVRRRITSFTFGENVQYIPDYLCCNMYNLSSVTLPNSVTSIGSNVFANWKQSGTQTIFVPCGKREWFQQMLPNVANIIQYLPYPSYTIASIAENGYITHTDTNYTICDEPLFSCTAIPYYGYHFTQWSDGNTDNPRIITLTRDTTLEALFAPNTYNINVTCNIEQGSIEGESGEFDYLTEKSYKAIPKYGYHFEQWSDSTYVCDNGWDGNCWYGHWEKNTENPRTIVLTRDTAISAIFVPNTYTIVDNSDQTRGRINGVGSFDYLSHQEVTAIPVRGYQFVRWADGNTNNPRTIELTQDTTIEAIFNYLLSGKCGKDSALTWTLDTTTMALDVTGEGALSENYTYGTFIESLTIGNEVTIIGQSAFSGFTNLKNVILGSSVKVLEYYAFNNCSAIETITCYSQRPPTVNEYALYGLDYSTIVYVPAEYLETYQMHDTWGLYDVRPIGGDEPQTNKYAVTFINKEGEEFENAEVTITIPVAPKVEGFTFLRWEIIGGNLEDGFKIQAVYEPDGGSSLPSEVIVPGNNSQKLIREGNVYILRGDHTYTLTGQEIK